MSDGRPIGVFDSGVGGLTVLVTLQHHLPNESTVYVGDLARCPYGPRPESEVREFATQIGDLLSSQDIKLLVIACNTATAAAYAELRERYRFPVVGVITPGAAEAARRTLTGRIGVVATDGTVAGRAYTSAITACLPGAYIVERAASWLVPLIEAGELPQGENAVRFASLVTELRSHEIDTLILGCTHFPLVRTLFEEGMGPGVTVLDSATTTTYEVMRLIAEFEIEGHCVPHHRLLVTGPSRRFAERAQTMFGTAPPIETIDVVAPCIQSL